jgi:hypothetical protein
VLPQSDALTVAATAQVLADHLGTPTATTERQMHVLLSTFETLQGFWLDEWALCQRQGWVETAAGRRSPIGSLKDAKVRCAI